MIRRIAAITGLVSAAILAFAAPSLAATTPTFNKQPNQNPGCVKYNVDSGGLVADAVVCYNPSITPSGGYDVTVTDDRCDNLGLTFDTWLANGEEATQKTNGCKNDNNKPSEQPYTLSSLGSPHNWWLEWDGTNSPAYSWPAAP